MIVVDASTVVDVLTGVDGTEPSRDELLAGDLHAPTLLDYEVVSALRGLTLRHALSASRALDALTDFDDLPVRRWPDAAALRARAFALRECLSAYDAAYVALAEALACPLVTRDGRLARSTGHDADIRLR